MNAFEVRKKAFAGVERVKISESLARMGFQIFPWKDAPSVVWKDHWHNEDQLIVIVAGSMMMKVDQKEYALSAGDQVNLPRQTIHATEVSDQGCEYFICELSAPSSH